MPIIGRLSFGWRDVPDGRRSGWTLNRVTYCNVASSTDSRLVQEQHFETRAQAESAIREYIEIFYNRQRRHSRIGYLAPAVFAQSFTRLAA
jgi:transposase InsO family protein